MLPGSWQTSGARYHMRLVYAQVFEAPIAPSMECCTDHYWLAGRTNSILGQNFDQEPSVSENSPDPPYCDIHIGENEGASNKYGVWGWSKTRFLDKVY